MGLRKYLKAVILQAPTSNSFSPSCNACLGRSIAGSQWITAVPTKAGLFTDVGFRKLPGKRKRGRLSTSSPRLQLDESLHEVVAEAPRIGGCTVPFGSRHAVRTEASSTTSRYVIGLPQFYLGIVGNRERSPAVGNLAKPYRAEESEFSSSSFVRSFLL